MHAPLAPHARWCVAALLQAQLAMRNYRPWLYGITARALEQLAEARPLSLLELKNAQNLERWKQRRAKHLKEKRS